MANKTKHTPGPWRAEEVFPGGGPEFSIKAAGKDYHVCGCGAYQHSHPAASFTRDEGQANARLIAAAPELLEALRGMVGLHDNGTAYDSATTIAYARAAILKAEGKD